jgi:WD40 repeat protein
MVLSVLGFALLAAWGTSRARQAQQAARRARDLTRIAAVREIESDASKAAAILREVENPDPAFVPRWIDLAHRALRESASMAVELWGRQLTFESITLSPDGSQLLSASADGKVYLWPLDGTLGPEALTADDSPLNCAVFSPDGSLIATGAVDGMVRVWQRGQPQPFREYHSHANGIFSLVFSPDGQSLLSASEDGTAQVRDVARPRSGPRVLQHDNAVLGARFSPDGSAVLTWSMDGTARLWDPRDGGALAVLRHGSPLSTADFSPDGLYVVTAGDDGTARLWDTRSEALKPQRVLSGHTGPVVAVAFSADSQRIATASRDHTARTFSVATGDALHVFRHAVSLSRVRWTRSGKLLLTAGEDGHIKLWPADGSRGRISLRGHRDDVNDVLFTLGEKRVISASRDGTARVWDLHESGGMRLLWEAPAPPAHITLSASARWVAAEHEAGVRLYDLGERRLIELSEPRPSDPPDGRADVLGANPHDESALLRLPSVAPPNSPLVSLAFDPSGERLATLRGDGKVRIFRSADGSPLAEVTVPAGSDAVVPSPDGQYLLSARGSLATLTRLGGAEASSVLLGNHTGAIRRMAVSPDGSWVLTTSYDHSVRAWQPKSPGRPVEFTLHRSPVLAAAFGPEGRLATAGQDGRVLIWSLSRPESAVALQGPSDVISWLAISPDGQHVVAAAQSGTARVWRTDGTGYPIVLSDLESPLQSAQFLPDGKRVVTAASDGTVRSWEVDPDLVLLRQRLWQRTPYCMPWEQRVDLFGETDPIAARNESLCRDMQLCLRRPGGEYRRCLAEFTARQERAQQSHQSLLDQLEDLRAKRER